MNFAEKLKTLRKDLGMSQEQLAEKIYVSRQAITKWENGNGIPDIENLLAISSLFNESLDSLLSEEKSLISKHDFLYESRTEYDLDSPKKIDLKVGVAHEVIIEKTKDEKIQVIAASNKLSYLAQQVKVKIVENKKRMDVLVNHTTDLSDISAEENLFILVRIPEKFVADMELFSELENLKIRDISFDTIEFDGKTKKVFITNASGHIELNTNSKINVEVNGVKGKIDLNHFHTTSKVTFAQGQNYYLKNAGRFTHFVDAVSRIIEGKRETKDPEEPVDLIVELNGWKSETQIFQAE
ncbi:MAG: helix-turn-helix domain-containing protein [Treponemataceae bacterium]|nr:helix-turn-helix domain-containing protein [Treponemataceae bacterium]